MVRLVGLKFWASGIQWLEIMGWSGLCVLHFHMMATTSSLNMTMARYPSRKVAIYNVKNFVCEILNMEEDIVLIAVTL